MSTEQNKISDQEAAKILAEKERTAQIEFDKVNDQSQNSLGKAASYANNKNDENSGAGSNLGWKPVPIDTLPSGGMFYPVGTTLEIRAAMVQEIRHFSTLDENDPLDMDDKLNLIIDKCVRIKFPDKTAQWKDLKEEDRFYLIFAVRDITFINGENKLYVTSKCGKTCMGDGSYTEKIELSRDNFSYYKIDEKLLNFYDENERCFKIDSPKVGTIKLYVPSLGVTSFIKNYLRSKVQNGDYYDKAFLKIAPFMFPDWRGLDDKAYNNKVQESLGWPTLKLSAIMKMTEMIRFGVKTEMTRACNKCGAEVHTPLNFPGGVKSLFLSSDPFEDLF